MLIQSVAINLINHLTQSTYSNNLPFRLFDQYPRITDLLLITKSN